MLKNETVQNLDAKENEKPLKLPSAMRAGLRAKVADRMKADPEFRKKVITMTEAKITDRASNLTETQRAKIRAHLNILKKQQQNKPQYLSEAHQKSSEAKQATIKKCQESPTHWDEIDRQIDESFKVHGQKNPNKKFNSFDWTTLTKKELDELYHKIIDKALENYEYRLHVLFKWKINHEQFHYRATRSLAIRIRREEERLKKHQIIGDYFKKRWANMTPEEAKADRQWLLDQGRLRNPN